MVTGSANLTAETAKFASRRGLGVNLAPIDRGMYNFLPRAIPYSLLAAAGYSGADPLNNQYRAYLQTLTPAGRRELEEAGRRCEW